MEAETSLPEEACHTFHRTLVFSRHSYAVGSKRCTLHKPEEVNQQQ